MAISAAFTSAIILVLLSVICILIGGLLFYLRWRKLRKQVRPSVVEVFQDSSTPKALPLPPKRETLRFELDAVDSEKRDHSVHTPITPPPKIPSRSGSFATTGTGRRKSLKLVRVTPVSSVRSMPLDVKQPSFPNQNPLTLAGANSVQVVDTVPAPSVPTLGRLRAWEVEILRSPSLSANSDAETASTASSPTFPQLPIQSSSDAPRLDLPTKDFRASFRSLYSGTDLDPQSLARSNVIPRRPVPSLSRRQSRKRPTLTKGDDVPPSSLDQLGERPFYGGTIHQWSSSRSTVGSASIMNGAHGDSVATILKLQDDVTVGSDWGVTIPKEIVKTLEDSQSLSTSPVYEHFGLRRSSTSISLHGMSDGLDKTGHRRMGSIASHKTSLSSSHLLRTETDTLHEHYEPQEELHSLKSLPNLSILPSTVYSPTSDLGRADSQPKAFRKNEIIKNAPLSVKTLPDLPLLPASVYAPIFRPKARKTLPNKRREDNEPQAVPQSSKTLSDLPLLPAPVYSPEPSPKHAEQSQTKPATASPTPAVAVSTRPTSDVLSNVYDSYWEESDLDQSKKREPLPNRSKSERWTPAVSLTAKYPALLSSSFVPVQTLQQRSSTQFPL